MRKSLVVVATVASLVVSPALAQAQDAQYAPPKDGGTPSYDPYGYPSGPYPSEDPTSCQYELGCEGPYQYLAPGPLPGDEAAAIAAGEVMQAGAVEGDSAPIKAASGDPEDAETFRSAIEAARADRAGGIAPASASEPAVEVAAVEGGAPVGTYSGDAAGDTEEVQEAATPGVEEEPVQPVAAPVAGKRSPEEEATPVGEERSPEDGDKAASDEADDVGGAAGGGGPGGAGEAPFEFPFGSNGALPLALLGGGSALLVGTGLVLRRTIR